MTDSFKKLLKMGELKCVAIKSPGISWSQNLNATLTCKLIPSPPDLTREVVTPLNENLLTSYSRPETGASELFLSLRSS